MTTPSTPAELALVKLLGALSPLTIFGKPIAHLDINLAKAIAEAVVIVDGQVSDTPKADDDLIKFMDGAVGVVEANSFEKSSLWADHAKDSTFGAAGRRQCIWVDDNRGLSVMVGYLADAPTYISFYASVIDGHKVLFMDAGSQVVDHRLIDAWLKKNLPKSAFRDGGVYPNKVDAQNFFNVFPSKPYTNAGPLGPPETQNDRGWQPN